MTEPQESFPEFFALAPTLCLYDPLAEFLGASHDGILEYRYADAVRLAGHSCPVVAGAFLLVRLALRALYGDSIPRRGDVSVAVRSAAQEGTSGVVGTVAALITGAAGAGGFPGLGGRFKRRGLLGFGVSGPGQLRFTRLETGEAVDASMCPAALPGNPRMGELMARCLDSTASPDERVLFRSLWQAHVRVLLLEHADDHELFQVWRASAPLPPRPPKSA